ncbi:MAG TPA: hypothetical protein VEJ63_17105 [Planctomycetota bacterium]|nr:hypothetical protein [Planctomycetota bacterium]
MFIRIGIETRGLGVDQDRTARFAARWRQILLLHCRHAAQQAMVRTGGDQAFCFCQIHSAN